ncbi:MAG: hypothetical protein J6D08_06920 [Lachnospiraceae bacterium]|nr:hypothetical protein [Lachnospiraceae bacterium]
MMDDRTERKAYKVCGAAALTLLLVLFLAVEYDYYYDLNDDTMIKDILSGAYTGTPSGYCIQMLYPLAWVIALFYRAIPTVPWYGLFLCLCQFGVFGLITLRLLCIMRSRGTKLMALAAVGSLVPGLFLRELVILQYSVTSGICMTGAVFLFLTTPQTQRASVFLKRNLVPLMLVVLSFLIRTEVCLMLMPFLLLAGMVKWCAEEKFFTGTNMKKYLTLIATAFLFMTAVYSIDTVAYQGSDWRSFRAFFDARTKLYDFYGLPQYEEHQAFYESIGLSKESYTLLENYNFALDESIDTWSLEAIVDYQEQLAAEGKGLNNTFGFVSKNNAAEAVWCYKNQLVSDMKAIKGVFINGISSGTLVRLAVMAAYLLYAGLCIVPARGKMRAQAVMKIVCLMIIRGILWLYLYMVDRVLDRVTVPLLMMELTMLAGFMICDVQSLPLYEEGACKEKGRKVRIMAAALYLLCIAGALAGFHANMRTVQAEYDSRAAADANWNRLMDYCRENGNNYYVIDVYSSTSYQGAPYSEKIFQHVDNSFKNFDICGGWAAKSPLARQKLARCGFKDIQSALVSTQGKKSAKAYFAANTGKDLEWLVQYYQKRGILIEPERVEQTAVFDIYALTPRTKSNGNP